MRCTERKSTMMLNHKSIVCAVSRKICATFFAKTIPIIEQVCEKRDSGVARRSAARPDMRDKTKQPAAEFAIHCQ